MTIFDLSKPTDEWYPKPLFPHLVKDKSASLRKIIRDEIRANQDRQSFVAAGEYMTLEETACYLRMGRTALYAKRKARKLAKTKEAKDRSFAPIYPNNLYRKSDIDAWMALHAD